MATLTPDERADFRELGYVRVRGAFDPGDAARMRDEVWLRLERHGVRRDDPATWTDEAPTHLQPLKRAAAFRAIGTPRTIGAIDDLLGPGAWDAPTDWGAFFVLFPTPRPWTVPHGPWHIDAPYTDPLEPLLGVKVHSVFGDVAPRAGGMTVVAGSHRMVARFVDAHPPEPGASMRRTRLDLLRSDPWLRDLTREVGEPDERIACFVDTTTDVLGVAVRVAELTASAGDVILVHPLLMHARPTNAGNQPRFLCNKDLRVRGARW